MLALGEPRDAIGAGVLRQPALVDGLGGGIVVGPVEEHHLAGKLGLLKHTEQVFLGSARFGEDHGLLLQGCGSLAALRLSGGGKAPAQGGQQDFPLGVLDDRPGQGMELPELRHFLP